jgi:hypothetical protein
LPLRNPEFEVSGNAVPSSARLICWRTFATLLDPCAYVPYLSHGQEGSSLATRDRPVEVESTSQHLRMSEWWLTYGLCTKVDRVWWFRGCVHGQHARRGWAGHRTHAPKESVISTIAVAATTSPSPLLYFSYMPLEYPPNCI